VRRGADLTEGRSAHPPASQTSPRWSSMAVGCRCAVLSATSDGGSATDSKSSEHRALTTSLLSAIAEAPPGTPITPALLHGSTATEVSSDRAGAQRAVLVGSSVATRAPLFRTR
jgi:hypothetical protein